MGDGNFYSLKKQTRNIFFYSKWDGVLKREVRIGQKPIVL